MPCVHAFLGMEVLEMTKKTIIQAPCIDQTADWPTGCESVSTVMLLQYLGIHISVDDFIGYWNAGAVLLYDYVSIYQHFQK